MEVTPRESIILVAEFEAQISWYCKVMGFSIMKRFDEFQYCNLENASGIRLAIAVAAEMKVELRDRASNSIVLQFAVEDVRKFLEWVETNGGTIVSQVTYNEKDAFWFGSFADPEGNTHWVVDFNCP